MIKKELDQSLSVSVDNIKESSHNSAMIDIGNEDLDSLHFSLKKLPEYKLPNLSEWPQFNGHWKNALSVYVKDKDKRDNKLDICIFYEDEQFVIIYDRYYKSKYHLLIEEIQTKKFLFFSDLYYHLPAYHMIV